MVPRENRNLPGRKVGRGPRGGVATAGTAPGPGPLEAWVGRMNGGLGAVRVKAATLIKDLGEGAGKRGSGIVGLG